MSRDSKCRVTYLRLGYDRCTWFVDPTVHVILVMIIMIAAGLAHCAYSANIKPFQERLNSIILLPQSLHSMYNGRSHT